MVRDLTSSDQAIVWGLVVVDKQVLMDQARRPFSAIFAWNLKQEMLILILEHESFNLETGSTRRPDHWWAISKWRLVESVAPSKAPASTKNPKMGPFYHCCLLSLWWFFGKACGPTKKPKMGDSCALSYQFQNHLYLLMYLLMCW